MQVQRVGEFYAASYITGPTHNLLRLKLRFGSASDTCVVHVLPPVGECRHGNGLKADDIAPFICAGVERANAELGTSFRVERAEIVENDSPQPPVYEHLARHIVKEAARVGACQEEP